MKKLAFALPALVPALLLAGGNHLSSSGKDPFRVVFEDQGIHLLPAPPAKHFPPGVNGTVAIRSRKRREEAQPLEVVRDSSGRTLHLMLRRDFSRVRDGSRKARFVLNGFPGGQQKFSQVLRRSGGEHSGAMHAGSHSAGSHKAGHGMAGSHSSHNASSTTSRKAALSEAADLESIRRQRPSYPLDFCVVTGEDLPAGDAATEILHEGRLVRFCCKGCIASFRKSPKVFLSKLDAAARGQRVSRPAGSGSAMNHQGHPQSGHDHTGHAH